MILHIYTIFHTLIALLGILTGFVVLGGLLTGKRLDGWTRWFLVTTVATTVTGFLFPFHGVTPAIILGIITVPILATTIYARYPRNLRGPWRWIYVIGALLSLYLNVFVGIVQSFQKIPALKAIAPTQTEPPFQITQLIALCIFIVLIILGIVRFKVEPPPQSALGT
ncbi:MAG TPA: hypothetical protein VGI60_10530 [Chthoniobacterales bacterium]